MHSKNKHIPIKYHYLGKQTLDQKIKLDYVNSKEKIADIFTKPLPKEAFENLRNKLGVIQLPQQKNGLLHMKENNCHVASQT